MRWRAATTTMSLTLGPLVRSCLPAASFSRCAATAATKDEFAESIRPVLAQNCAACHNPNNPRNRINFLKANTIQDIESNRGLWRNVAAQLRNRTMPPVETKLTEDDRLRVATWIDNRLRQTACAVGDFAGAVALRRLNRREYHNTIRDLLGVDYNVSELFPNDGTGGSGFDTNGETLFIPPLLVERYVEAAQQILDRAIITPDLAKTFTAAELLPAQSPATTAPRDLAPGKELTAMISIYVDGDYLVQAAVERKDGMGTLALKVDGAAGVPLVVQQGRGGFGGARTGPGQRRARRRASPRLRRAGSSGARSARALAGFRNGAGSRAQPHPATEALQPHARKTGVALPPARRRAGRRTACRHARRPNRSCAPSCARPTAARWKPPTSRRS